MHPLIEKIAGKKKDKKKKKSGKKWIQKAIKKPGALHKQLGVPEGKKIPKSKLKAAAKKKGKLGRRARLAETLEKLGIAKEAQKPGILQKIKGGAKKAGKYAKWGGLGLGVYLTLKALEGAKEAKQEATHRW